jgi:hypothetical protein
MTREEILAHMMRDLPEPLSDLRRQRILDAMAAFSLVQLQQMDSAGLRIWPVPNTLPPEFNVLTSPDADTVVEIPNLGSPAAYQAAIRVIRVFPHELDHGRAINRMRHELAHAWDDVRNEGRVQPLDSMPAARRRSTVIRRSGQRRQFGSDMPALLPPYNLPMSTMFERYRGRMSRTLREFSFAHSSTAESHAARTVQEFYAEGYSVFFGTDAFAQARLLHFAPELFAYFETEARRLTLPPPSRDLLQNSIREQRLPAISDPPTLPRARGSASGR